MMPSRWIRAFSLFAVLVIAVLFFGRTSQANTYETSLLDILEADGRFNTYLGALERTGLDQMLKYNGDFTVFAPTDTAFAQLPPATRNTMFADTNTLKQAMLHHMLLSKWQTNVIGGWDVAHSLLGKQIEVRVQSGGVLILDEARVINGDVVADNGVLHVVNGVLIPPTGAYNSNLHQSQGSASGSSAESTINNATGTLYEILITDTRFSTLVSAVKDAGLTQMLDKNGPFTLFAPTNAAFEALPAGMVDALLADQTAVRQLILFHMAQGRHDAERVESLQALRMALGKSAEIELRNGNLFIDGARITIEDIEAENGIIHVINAVMVVE